MMLSMLLVIFGLRGFLHGLAAAARGSLHGRGAAARGSLHAVLRGCLLGLGGARALRPLSGTSHLPWTMWVLLSLLGAGCMCIEK